MKSTKPAQVGSRKYAANLSGGLILIFALLGAAISGAISGTLRNVRASPPVPEPEPQLQPIEDDRLALPVLPDNPTPIELGNYIYYYHCMPCHGDRGQGLTDEFRQIWVEDHRNCWAMGCHGGRSRDEGFPIPHFIPGVRNLGYFADAQALFDYLKTTHPPQEPGRLTDEQYWALTAFLFHQAGRPIPEQALEYPLALDLRATLLAIATLAAILILLPGALDRQAKNAAST